MTKTLTEQWREGKLPVGNYYINLVGDVERIDFFEGLEWERTKDFGVEEVLGLVPSYDHFSQLVKKVKKLEQQLKSARNVIKKYDGVGTIGVKDKNGKLRICRPASQYLKRWGVK